MTVLNIKSVWKWEINIIFQMLLGKSVESPVGLDQIGSTLYSEGWFVRRFFSPKPLGVPMLRRTYGPKVLYPEVPLVRRLLCSDDFIFRKALFPKILFSENCP